MFNDEILCDASFYIASFRIQIKQYQVILCLTFCYRFWLHVHGIKLLLQSIQHIHKDQITRLAFGLRFISKYTTLNEMLWTKKILCCMWDPWMQRWFIMFSYATKNKMGTNCLKGTMREDHLSGSHLLSEQVHLEGNRASIGSFLHLEQSSHWAHWWVELLKCC